MEQERGRSGAGSRIGYTVVVRVAIHARQAYSLAILLACHLFMLCVLRHRPPVLRVPAREEYAHEALHRIR